MNKAKQLFQYLFCLSIFLRKPWWKSKKGPSIYLSLHVLGNTSYYSAIAIRLAQSGYTVYLLHNPRLLIACYDRIRGRVMLKYPGIYLKPHTPSKRSRHVLIHDFHPLKTGWKAVIKLSTDSLPFILGERQTKDDEYVYPFDIHLRQFNAEESFPDLTDRRITVAFVGNIREEMYSGTAIASFFNLVERTEAIANIFKHFDELVTIPESKEDYGNKEKIKLLVGGFGHSIVPSTTPQDFITFLRECDFFIALPGVNIPFCHNLIESMMCGCIPIIQYGNLLPTPLKDGVNCLAYDSIPSLLSAIERAMTMQTMEKLTLKKNVREYYEKHLSKAARINFFKNEMTKISTMYFTATETSLRDYHNK